MGKDQDLLQATKDADVSLVYKILNKNRNSKTKIIGSNKKLNLNHQDNDGMSALHQAALVGNMEIILALLEGGAHVDLMDSKGMRPLHYASWQGKDEPVKLLLQWNSSATEAAYDGETPLHLACQYGHFQVVNLLLCYNADPTVRNKEFRTVLDLACEFGHYRVAELLLSSNLCNLLLQDSPDDMLDNDRTTCLHLAAKNGHSEITRLLIIAGVNINRETLQGTALHEAALSGKIDIVKVLLENGIDINRANSYDQTALDIVNRFTASRAAKTLKEILKQASNAITVRALEDYYDQYDPGALTFSQGDYIQVLEQHQDGIWKGYTLDGSHQVVKSGYFPASSVQVLEPDGKEYSSLKRNKKFSSHSLERYPGLPGERYCTSIENYSTNSLDRRSVNNSPMKPSVARKGSAPGAYYHPQHHHGPRPTPPPGVSSHFSSIGHDESFPPPPSPLTQKTPQRQDSFTYDGGPPFNYDGAPPAYSHVNHHCQPQISYSIGNHSPNTMDHPYISEMADYRAGSPCRDSPTGSNRNSSASTDSGRGTAYFDGRGLHNFINVQINQHRLSGQSYESGVSSRQSYHSNSSSSLGSLDRLEESGYSSQVNVAELVQQGMAQDTEIIHVWLTDLHYDEYYNNFVGNGYDMGTISRMTPEDLTAIGITKPGHRKRLKSEIARLHIPDGIPDHTPTDLGDWLQLLNLDHYYETLSKQSYTMDNVTEITWEDLEEIGITKLGHQKKVLLAIDRLKKLAAGARRASITMQERRGSADLLHNGPNIKHSIPQYTNTRWSAEMPTSHSQFGHDVTIATINPRKSPSGDSINSAPELKTFLPMDECRTSSEMLYYRPKRFGSAERDSPVGSILYGLKEYSHPGSGDVTPTNERSATPDNLDSRRPSAVVNPRINGILPNKQKPVAMIVAKTRRSNRDTTPEIIEIDDINEDKLKDRESSNSPTRDDVFEKPEIIGSDRLNSPRGSISSQSSGSSGGSGSGSYYGLSSQVKSKKPPPPPPKRTNSVRSDSKEDILDDESDLSCSPPPPPPPPPLVMRDALEHSPHISGCIKSLSEKFCRRESGDRLPFLGLEINRSKVEFPPPPSPLLGNRDVSSLPPKPGIAKQQEALKSYETQTPIESNLHKAMKKENELILKKEQMNTIVREKKYDNLNSPIKLLQKEIFMKQLENNSKESSHELPQVKPKSNSQARKVEPPVVPKTTEDSGSDIDDGNATVRRNKVKRNESTTSLDSNISTCSTDSNTLPFANENVGTIKQRNPVNKPSIVPVNIDDDTWEETATMKRRPSNQSAEVKGREKASVSQRAANATAAFPDTMEDALKVTKQKGPNSGNVLNDIGNMLQDLTDELDAMLEFECTT